MSPLITARVRSTGKLVRVYKRWDGVYVDYSDYRVEYKPDELEIL